ncbi:MAG: lytic transglycosylase domain-containing protein [Tannerellaceae bacterium]|nr:lytic transglycosylase domain-containing protein [Tannerellaceae bacterium]
MRLSKNNIISFVAVAVVCLTACISMSSNDSEKVKEERPLVSALTTTPNIPSSVQFCGEQVDLTRYNRHESFDRELSSFTYLHATTMLLFKRANRYFPVIEPILKEYGIPDDFKYLAVIESHLDPRVSSPAKAVGMWQFLETTGKENGLTITTTMDERSDVAKSTVAACKYLNSAYKKYGDWVNVAASYNAGMGRITGEITKQQVDSSLEMWLVEETSRYVYRIMAIKQIFENPYKYGFVIKPQDLYKPIKTKTVTVTKDIDDLAAFAKQHGVDYADLKRFNTWLRDRKLVTGGKSYQIQIPEQSDMYYKSPNTYVHDSRWVVK